MLTEGARGFHLAGEGVSGPVLELPGLAAPGAEALPAAGVAAGPGGRWFRLCKRAFDVGGALIGMLVCAPLVLAVVAAVRLSSRGPAFYSQLRIGRHGRYFRCWKFRTMVLDADGHLVRLLDASPALRNEYTAGLKLRADPRVTGIGRLLRRTSLDELPQLWNVLKGDMTLVGPRPLLIDEPDRYGDALDTVLRVRPGLTGIWQVSGRNAVPYQLRVAMQAQQAEQTALWRDFLVVLRTLAQMVRWRSSGAW
ncbi:MAG TPA: sugar transferase [Acidimicrobiales bacterium]|jgi:undecaprenyl-phosphate galactose phosphotransferase|nr:sugar transferase [Acidimicrobiales bacterium]